MSKKKNRKETRENQLSQDDIITIQYRYVEKLAQQTYEEEIRREQNLIQQSSQMQTAFSFVIAAVFMVIPIGIEHRGRVPLNFFIISMIIISGFLLFSLLFSSLAQWRWKSETLGNINDIKNSVMNIAEWEKFLKEYHQLHSWIEMMDKVQKSKVKINNRRVVLIMLSMIFFYLAIATIIILFIFAVGKYVL